MSISFPVIHFALSHTLLAGHMLVCVELGSIKKGMNQGKRQNNQSFQILFESLLGLFTIWDYSLLSGYGILPVVHRCFWCFLKKIQLLWVTPSQNTQPTQKQWKWLPLPSRSLVKKIKIKKPTKGVQGVPIMALVSIHLGLSSDQRWPAWRLLTDWPLLLPDPLPGAFNLNLQPLHPIEYAAGAPNQIQQLITIAEGKKNNITGTHFCNVFVT